MGRRFERLPRERRLCHPLHLLTLPPPPLAPHRGTSGSVWFRLGKLRAAFLADFERHKFQRHDDERRNDHEVVQVTYDGDEIRDEVEREERVGNGKPKEHAGKDRRARMLIEQAIVRDFAANAPP